MRIDVETSIDVIDVPLFVGISQNVQPLKLFFPFQRNPRWRLHSYDDVKSFVRSINGTFNIVSRHENLVSHPNTSREKGIKAFLLITAPHSGQMTPNFFCILQRESRSVWPNLVFGNQSLAEIWANILFGAAAANCDWLTQKVGMNYHWSNPKYVQTSWFYFKLKHIKRYDKKQCFANYSAS